MRFSYPDDKSVVVYFEWEAPPGNHILTGIWKDPGGQAVSLSKDINLQTRDRQLRAFWQFALVEDMAGGIWTLEVRVDGRPAGSHVFEVSVPEVATPSTIAAAPAPAVAAPPTLDEIYRNTLRSLVWVYRIDGDGRRIDTGSGFVIGKDQVATAFQNVDAAEELEIEFDDGRIVRTAELLGMNRMQDWAVVRVDTMNVPALERETADVSVGARLVVLNSDSAKTRPIGGVDVGGRQDMPGFSGRLQLIPGLNREASGGPLLSLYGRVVGIIGGNVAPGARLDRRVAFTNPISGVYSVVNGATPFKLLPETLPGTTRSLKALLDSGLLTPPLTPLASFSYGGVTSNVPRDVDSPMPRDVTEFSRRDPLVWVYTWWQKKEKTGKGAISATVYDFQNRVRLKSKATKANLRESAPTRYALSFSPEKLERGTYRVDILWDDQVVWRTFFSIVD